MVASFLLGCVSGAALMKYYGSVTEEEDNGGGDLQLTPSDKRLSGVTSSRATQLNKASGVFYNETADNTGASHVNFLSDLVERLWPFLRDAGAITIRETIEPTFKDLPGPLSTLKFTKLDLGEVPFVLDNILVRELRKIDDAGMAYGTNQHYLQFEWDITWQSKCDIQLSTESKVPIKVGVKTFTLSGRLQVIAKPLSGVLPCMDAIQFAFVNSPKIDLDFTGLANLADMNVKIGSYSVVDIAGFVRKTVDDILAQTMVLPNRTFAPLVDGVDFRDCFSPPYKGLCRVRLHKGRGFEIQKALTRFGTDDVPDVYVKMRVGVEKFFVSSVCKDNCNPVWDPEEEFQDFCYCQARDQILELHAWDRDEGKLETDDYLGTAFVTVGQVLLEADANGLFEVQLMEKSKKKGKNDKPTGQYLTISLEKLPFTSKNLSSMQQLALMQSTSKKDLSNLSARERKKLDKQDASRIVGLQTIVISHAENLPFPREEDANTYVKVFAGTGSGKTEIGVTPPIPNSLNPPYHTPFSKPLTVSYMKEWNQNRGQQCFTFQVFQLDPKNAKAKPQSLGEIVIDQSEIKVGDEWSLRESRSFGTHPGTKLSFAISFAGVAPSPKKKLFSSRITPQQDGAARDSTTRSLITATDSEDAIDEGIEVSGQGSFEVAGQDRIRVRIVKGYGFQTEKKGRLRKADIPDVYCMIKFGSRASTWRTPTIKDSETPEWDDEHKDFTMESMNEVISIDVWDENRKGQDDYYGNARTTVGKVLLNNGFLDVEVKPDGISKNSQKKGMATKSNIYITVQCEKL